MIKITNMTEEYFEVGSAGPRRLVLDFLRGILRGREQLGIRHTNKADSLSHLPMLYQYSQTSAEVEREGSTFEVRGPPPMTL